MQTIAYLAKQGVAYRGHFENEDSFNLTFHFISDVNLHVNMLY